MNEDFENYLMSVCLLFVLVFLLTACTTAQAPSVVEVKVPYPVPCVIEHIDSPAFAVDALPVDPPAGMKRSDFVFQQLLALRAERLQRQAYEKILEAAITACQK